MKGEFKDAARSLVWEKLSDWPQENLFPVIDLQRLYILHPGSTELFKGTDKGAKIIARMLKCLKADTNGPLGLCAARFLANLFQCGVNKHAIYDKRRLVLDSIGQVIPSVTNK